MSVTGCAADTELPESDLEGTRPSPGGGSQPVTSQPPKGVLVGFAATVTIGLALGSWYVGVRIVAAEAVAPSVAAATPAVNSVPSNPASQSPMPEAPLYIVPPAEIAFYLQVAGLGPQQDADYVKWLHHQGFTAVIRAPDKENGARILIGPFLGQPRMEKARRKLHAAGVLAIEGTY